MAAKIISLLAVLVLHAVSAWALRHYGFGVPAKELMFTVILLTCSSFLIFVSNSRNWNRLSENHPVLSEGLRAACLAGSLGCDFASLLMGWQLVPVSLLFTVAYVTARWLLLFASPYCVRASEKTSTTAPLSSNISIWTIFLGSPVLFLLMHAHGFGLQVHSWWLLIFLLIAQDGSRILAAIILQEKTN